MSRLSIVIPCLGGAAEFDGTLVSVLQNRPADCEVLVAHTEPYDDPYRLSTEVRFLESTSRCLVDLLNLSLREASGDVLHVVGCGLEASEDWTAPALQHFDDPEVAAVSPIIIGPDCQKIIAAGVRWSLGGARQVLHDRRIASPGSGRMRARIHGPTLAAAFYRRDVLAAIGGFDTALGDGLADIGVALALQSLGRLHVCEPASRLIRTSEPAAVNSGGFANGRAAERLFWRYAAKRGLGISLGLHPLTIAGDVVHRAGSLALLTSLVGRMAAWFEIGGVQRHDQHLAAAGQRLKELAELRASVRKSPKRGRLQDREIPAQRRRAA